MDMKKAFIIVITILIIIINKNTCSAQIERDTLKILFVGNSYTYYENLPQIISIISDSSKTKLITKKSTLGGSSLSEHWRGARGLKTNEIIKSGRFDIVVLQEYSMGSINEQDSVHKYLKLFCDFIKDNEAKPYLYLTWAREKVPQYQETINKVYLEAAKENEAVIVPVGKAWALAKQLRPNIELYDVDGSHPSKLGTFLTACVFVATILDEIPYELPNVYSTFDFEWERVRLMDIDSLDVIFCQKIAKEIIKVR
jgi:hypothetical protein